MKTFKCACTESTAECGLGNCERMWTTREGERIPISKMETVHLLNTARMLERNAERRMSLTQIQRLLTEFPRANGEYAQLFAEEEFFDALDNMDAKDFVRPIYWHIAEELHKRSPAFISHLSRRERKR